MLLKELVIESREVALPGGQSLTVHGLTLEDITNLLGAFKNEISQIFNGGMDVPDMTSRAPLFTATLIAVGAGEPDAVEQARKLPLGTQMIALEEIWNLTLPDDDALGKLMARIEKLVSPSLQGAKVSGSKSQPSETQTSGNTISEL